MKFKTIKAFEEFFYFDQEEEFTPGKIQDDTTHEDEIIYDDVEDENGSEYNDPTKQELLPGDLPSDSDCDTCKHEEEYKPWGDESIRLERFSTFNEKKKAPKKDDKKEPAKKGEKPDFLDLNKNGDKKEPMKKAAQEAKEKENKGGKKFEKPKKGEIPAALAAYQKKKNK